MKVNEYRDDFIQLSKYAPRSAESGNKKREHFNKGLNEDLQGILSLNEYSSLQHVIDKAIELESKLQEISKKRKMEFLEQRDNNSHLYHLSQTPNYPEDEYEDLPRNHRNIKDNGDCFYCKAHRHFISRCPKKRVDRYEKKARQR
jgi:hypothetical protein